MQAAAVVAELPSILKKGDIIQSTRHPKLELKNFASAETRTSPSHADIENACSRAHADANKPTFTTASHTRPVSRLPKLKSPTRSL
jgi:hypothetical protein